MYLEFELLLGLILAAFVFGFFLSIVLNFILSEDSKKIEFTDTYERLKK